MVAESKLRQIKPLKLESDFLPASFLETDEKPEFKWVEPGELYVEEKYQRNLAGSSMKLIRKIVKDFDWSHFKPPVCSYGNENKIYVIDGQHTAIAAASHPKIKKIPVMMVEAATIRQRAVAFMGHNKDRVAITPMQLYHSAVAAEDPIALALKKALENTGCTIVRSYPVIWIEGQTAAATTLLKLAENKNTAGTERVLNILIDAKRAPLTAPEINATKELLWGKDWKDKFCDEDLALTIRSKSIEQWKATAEATVRKGMVMSLSRALAIAWFRSVKKKRSKNAA